MNGNRTPAGGILLPVMVLLLAGDLTAQPVTQRTPNIIGTWVTSPWNLHFWFNHRFRVFGDDVDVTDIFDDAVVGNSPTFDLNLGLWSPFMVGVQYASKPTIQNANSSNEWFPYLKAAPLRRRDWSVSVLGGYNTQAESFDGVVAGQASVGRLRLLGEARGFGDALGTDEAGLALAGGVGVKLTEFLALSGDVGGVIAGPDSVSVGAGRSHIGVAWSAGIQLGIPFTPHTFSLQASNAASPILQEASYNSADVLGGGSITWGFEFTVPFSGFARWGSIFARDQEGVRSAGAGAEPAGVVEIPIRELTFEGDTIRVPAGTAIRWVNRDPVAHNTKADDGSWESPLFGPGETYTTRLELPGRYAYVCTIHPFMRGLIIVEEHR